MAEEKKEQPKKKRGRPKKEKPKYYTLDRLFDVFKDDPENVRYLISFGKRGAGKSYDMCTRAIREYMKGGLTAFARRWDDDWGNNVATSYFSSLARDGVISRETKGEWSDVYYHGHRWFFMRYDEEKDEMVKSNEPFAYAFALNTWEKTKASQHRVTLLVVEEFITDHYIGAENKEFSMFLNLVSTLKRDRDDFLCVLLGNSIQREGNPYFKCMGIENRVLEMKPGELIVFKNDKSPLKIAVEFTPPPGEESKIDPMFAFTDSAAARMITQGDWQIERHFPELPENGARILPKEIIYKYYLRFRIHELEADVVLRGDQYFTYFHKNLYPLTEEEEKDKLIFELEHRLENNFRRDIMHPTDALTDNVVDFFRRDAVFVSDVEVGEILFSYLQAL